MQSAELTLLQNFMTINLKAKFKVLSISYGHEANACLMIDGKLSSYAAEERFNKKKCFVGYPRKSIDFCLKFSEIKAKDLDKVVFVSKNTTIEHNILKRNSTFSMQDFIREQELYWYPKIFKNKKIDYLDTFRNKIIPNEDFDFRHYLKTRKRGKKIDSIKYFTNLRVLTAMKHLKISRKKIIHIEHEKGHQYYALFASPEIFRKKTLILTNEGMGDKSNITVSTVKKGILKEIYFSKENKLGSLYKFMTLLLGMKMTQHEYKVMGLAPYASKYETNKAFNAAFKNLFKVKGLGIFLKNKPKDFFFSFKEKLKFCRFDGIAGALQKTTEEVLVKWIKNCMKMTKINSVVISGGVAQNIKSAIPISDIKGLKNFYINPSSGDSTLSVGGCYYVSSLNKNLKLKKLDNIYLGPSYKTDEVKQSLKKFISKNKNFYFVTFKNNKKIVNLLKSGKVLGRFSGRMEMGQRALGNRSIIADPRNSEIIKLINKQIKMRDFWMPFTPSILEERQDQYFINPKKVNANFMSSTFESTELAKKHLKGAVHPADYTIRPQVVKKDSNSDYYDLIKKFENLSGIGAVLNTSFNLSGFPNVSSPLDAVNTVLNSGLEYLVLENFVLEKKN